jgi:hypothetical protein
MADNEQTYDEIQATVLDERTRDARIPIGIRLGAAQLKVIDQAHRDMSGLGDVGPLTEFAGLPVLPSKAGDRVELVYAEESPEIEAAPAAEPGEPDMPEPPAP